MAFTVTNTDALMVREPKCKHCGLTEADHCTFEAYVIPDGCKCDPEDWGEIIPPICSSFTADPDQPDRCQSCEHEKTCHEVSS